MLTIGSLFSGIGGLEQGLERAGLGPVLWQVEMDPWCRRQLERHYPEAERFEDVKEVSAATLRYADIICGGFPCQDVSAAGARRGLSGERSGLWREFARVVSELRPRYVVVENVASGAKLWVDAVVRELGQLGYDCLPLPVSAESIGAPHRRERIFIVGRLVDAASAGRRPETGGECETTWVHGGRGRISVADGAGSGTLHGSQPSDSLLSDALRGGGAVPDSDRGGVRDQGETQPRLAGIEMAHGGGDGCEECRPAYDGDRGHAPRYELDGRAPRVVYPPRPGDVEGWERYLAGGGSPPGIVPPVRGGADGVPAGVARPDAAVASAALEARRAWRRQRREHLRALKALGNAVVPECAEVAGWVIRALEEGR